MADVYIDNNQTIYAVQRVFQGSIASGASISTYTGLQDWLDLSGQSTVFVNYLHFECWGTAENGGVGESHGHMISGIVPWDYRVGGPSRIEDFQLIKGWPFKNCKKFYYAYTGDTGNSANTFRMSFTWRPKKGRPLLINREQAVYVNVFNTYGQPIQGLVSITGQFKRGN